MKSYEEFDITQVELMNKNNEKTPTFVKQNIIDRIIKLSNEWWQEGMYCLNLLNNDERADVWFTVSDYLKEFAYDIEQDLEV